MTTPPPSSDVDQLIAQGVAHHQAGRVEQAESLYRQVLLQDPANPDAHYYLGMLAHQAGHFGHALPLVRKAIESRPTNALWLTNLGVVYSTIRQFQESVDCHRRAIEIDPQLPQPWLNLSGTLLDLGRPADAESAARTAIQRHAGDFPDAHWNLARALFLQGRFTEAFAENEWRLHKPGLSRPQLLHLPIPRWDGKPAPGKTLLLMAEPGFSDFVQYLRYAAVAAQRVPTILVECADQMLPLARSVAGISDAIPVIDPAKPAPPHDLQVPLISLPHVLGTGDDLQSASIPYVRPEAVLIDRWRNRLLPAKILNVGVVWAGNPVYERDPSRNTTLAEMTPFSSVPGVRFYGLTIGENRTPPSWLIQATAAIRDFADIAAIAANLDLIISVDTVIAQIAGAVGKPVWTLLPAVADHRWGAQPNSTAWYPNMRLFRQTRPGDWRGVIARVTAALKEHAAKSPVA